MPNEQPVEVALRIERLAPIERESKDLRQGSVDEGGVRGDAADSGEGSDGVEVGRVGGDASKIKAKQAGGGA